MSGARDFLIVRLAAAGDVLLTTALAHALHQACPEARVSWLTSAYSAPLLQGNPELEQILVTPTPAPGLAAQLRALRRMWRLLDAWRRQHPRAIVLLAHRSPRLRAVVRAAGLATVVGWGREAAFDAGQHRMQQLAGLMRAAGLDPVPAGWLRPQLHLSAEECAAGAAEWGQGPAAPRWVLAPGGAGNPWARMPNRRWAPERFGSLARRARAGGIAVRWVGGGGDSDVIHQAAPDLPASMIERLLRRSQRDVAAVIAAADLVIGNDSLPLVMAQALGRPALGLYGPTAGALIHAPGQPFVQGDAGCGPCYDPRRGLRGQAYVCARARCMEAIGAATVWQLARDGTTLTRGRSRWSLGAPAPNFGNGGPLCSWPLHAVSKGTHHG